MHLHFPEDLPVSARREDLAAAIRDHPVVVVAGETGSGKTTQLPKICLALGRGGHRLIGHTQPRRIAARSVAERISQELGVELGQEVGYQVRFTDRTTPASRIKVMTDGILLAELRNDPDLRRYDTLIIDEAHERSLNIDFLLGYLKRLLPRRPDLKLIITSATIDPEKLAAYFGDAPIIEVSGRTYPVEVRYRPLIEESNDDGEPRDEAGPSVSPEPGVVAENRDQTEAVVDAVEELCAAGPGDVLVFLPGEREIRDTADALGDLAQRRRFEVMPLYSRLSAAEQHRVFAAHPGRRVVLATNVAETSLTVPGIRYVVDTGLARISRYSARSKVQRLPIEPVSRASAQQRAGRCGRVAPGICIRLYSQEDFEGRPEFTDPEILRTNLASVMLQMASLRLGPVDRFEFLDPPDGRQVRAGSQLLEELGALRPGRGGAPRLTEIGRRLARLPIDPRMGRMILQAERQGCVAEVVVVVAALSIQDPRERPVEQRERADQLHARFRDRGSDFLTLLNLWSYLRGSQQGRGSSAFRRMCREEHLNYVRVREWQELVGQLRQICREMGMKPGRMAEETPAEDDEGGRQASQRRDWPQADQVHQALLAGLLSHVGLRDRERRDYLGARGTRFAIFPGSGLFRRQPEFAVAAELVETSRLYGREVAAIDPAWAERLGEHLLKRQYSEPVWSSRRASVVAKERVTLYGVPLAADRSVAYGRIDPVASRELFIRHALVQGEWSPKWQGRYDFLAENRRLLEEAEAHEHRARRRGIVVDEETLVAFYDERVGAEVVSGAHFDTWWRKARRTDPGLLTFDPAMLVHEGARLAGENEFPSIWSTGPAADLSVGYRFEPGSEADGVTVEVPVGVLHDIDPAAFSWQVPGMRQDLVTALLRSLPKRLRTSFVPAPDVARDFLAEVPAGEEALLPALTRYLRGRTGVVVPEDAWDLAAVPEHLRPRFRVVEEGREVAAGRDLSALREALRPRVERNVATVGEEEGLARTGETTWVFGTIPERVEQVRAGHSVRGYPTLIDEGDAVGLRVVSTLEEQEARHRLGVRRLVLLALPASDPLSGLENATRLALSVSPYRNVAALVADAAAAVVTTFVDEGPAVRDADSLDALVARVRPVLAERTRACVLLLADVLGSWRETQRLTGGRVEMSRLPAMTDMRDQLGRLFPPGFASMAGEHQLRRYPVYLEAVRRRVAGLGDLGRDRAAMERLLPVQEAWQHRMDALESGRPPDAALRRVRWMLEEYRISLWAETLGTDGRISDARIRKALG